MPASRPLPTHFRLGYCTNVHSGTDLATICDRLDEFAAPLAAAMPENESLGVGLWLPASATKQLASPLEVTAFADWLVARRLNPFTINAFPYDNFHLPVVKHRVYQPSWAEAARLEYTVAVAKILAVLLNRTEPNGAVGSISTLPIGWPEGDQPNVVEQAGNNLRKLATELEQIERLTGRRIVVAIEPEPGCLLDRCQDVIDFFSTQLADESQRKYLTVCHDICHSAVMFEDQAETLRRYAEAGLAIGKIQVSSAINVPLEAMKSDQRAAALNQLRQFAEDRYLHQTGCLDQAAAFRLIEDLPQWLAQSEETNDKHIRIHFHVPIFLDRFGELRSTQNDINECWQTMQSSQAPRFTGHWEIETYAWTVMPAAMRTGGLGADIDRELNWFRAMSDWSS